MYSLCSGLSTPNSAHSVLEQTADESENQTLPWELGYEVGRAQQMKILEFGSFCGQWELRRDKVRERELALCSPDCWESLHPLTFERLMTK